MLKKLISFILVLCLTATLCVSGFTASAAIVNAGKIEIDRVSAVTGDTVVVPIRMTENPGIMAITISITYNSKALEYEKLLYGNIVNDYTVVAHPDKNIIRFVNCESRDRTATGALVYLQFKVKEDAEADFHEMDIEYSAGDFCNWNLDKIMPEVTPGGVEVAFNGNNCTHKKYGEWTVAAEPSCDESGLDQRVCQTCGHIDLRDNAPIGHVYSDKWTIDQPATKEQDGIMTRYCIRCDDYVDRITFSLSQSEEGNIKNEINEDVLVDDYTEEIFKEQYPDKELTDSKPAATKKEDNSSENKDSSSSGSDNTSSSDSHQSSDTDSKNNVADKKDDSSKPDSNSDKKGNTITEIIDSIAPEVENSAGESVSVLEKIAEVFPNFENITNAFELAIIIIILLVI